jgi:general secretion pathway protein G
VIALAVLGLLVGIAVPLFGSYQDRVRTERAVQDMRIIEAAVERYMAEFQRVPSRIESVVDPVPIDPWGNPYQFLKLLDAPLSQRGMARKDKNLVPLNTDFDLYSKGKDGDSLAPLTAPPSKDDIIRANDGGYVGLAENY